MLRHRMTDPRARRLLTLGMSTLVIGVTLLLVVTPRSGTHHDALDAVSSLILGVSIACNLLAICLSRGSSCALPDDVPE